MANEPLLTLVGNLTSDPDLRTLQSGQTVTSFTVASTPREKNRDTGEWEDGEPLFIRCSAWREMGENVANSLTKGARVIVQGRLQSRSYEKDGERRTSLEMQVDEIGPSLRWATAQPQKAGWSGGRDTTRGQAPAVQPSWETNTFDETPPF